MSIHKVELREEYEDGRDPKKTPRMVVYPSIEKEGYVLIAIGVGDEVNDEILPECGCDRSIHLSIDELMNTLRCIKETTR